MLKVHVRTDSGFETKEGTAGLAAGEVPERGWIEAVAPAPEEARALEAGLGLHELAVEDAMRLGHPSKLEDFGDHLFLIAHTPDRDAVEGTRKLAIFLSRTWIVTIVRAPLRHVEEVRDRVARDPGRYLASPALLAHALLDHLTDGFEAGLDDLRNRIADLEERIESDPVPELMTRILELRRELGERFHVVRGQRDVAHALARSDHACIPKRMRPFLRDVYDHLLRTYEQMDSLREWVGAVRDAYLSAVNHRLSEIMRVLTVIATTMMPLSLLAGIYGMNFRALPGSAEPAGFWVMVAAMLVVAVAMLVFFRYRRWL